MNGGTNHSGTTGDKPALKLVGGEARHDWARAASRPRGEPGGALRIPGPTTRPRRLSPRDPAASLAAGTGATPSRESQPRPTPVKPMEASDPRWVLALRVAECLDGTTLAPERRRRLIRMGRVFGLTAFDANLIIAVIQDQARRGYRPDVCARMGEAQLQMIPLPRRAALLSLGGTPLRRWTTIAMLIVALGATELAVLWWLFT